jgi:superfamily I DNA/RNA helicase
MPWDQDLDPESPAYGIASSATRFNRVVAGPGTGKSFALKRRVRRLLEEGADPKRILPVTFTNVAAEDLQREMLRIGVPGCESIRGSTLHSLCMRILSRESVLQAVGRKPFARKVRMALEYKSLNYEAVDGLLKPNHQALKAVNGRIEVPALIDVDVLVVNSPDIVAYLDNRYPINSVYPSKLVVDSSCRWGLPMRHSSSPLSKRSHRVRRGRAPLSS